MTIDAIAREGHFVDHIAPVWLALPEEIRGTFYYRGRGRPRSLPGMIRGEPPRCATSTLVASTGDLKTARIRGRPAAIMEHGCGQSFGGDPRRGGHHSSYAGGNGRDAQLFLHPGPHPAARDRRRYPDARVEIVGCPKLDTLPRKPERDPRPVVAVAFHWECRVTAETRSGFRDFMMMVSRLAKSGEYRMIGHGHPRILGLASDTVWSPLVRWYRTHGIEVVYSFEEVCRVADVYLNDASSTLFEFASTGRPVVVLNASWYRREISHGLRFWDAATVGVQVEPREPLGPAVALALEDPPEQRAAREAALDLVYAYRCGGAERAAAALVDWVA